MSVDMERLQKQIAFCKEIDKEKKIGRQTYLADGSRKENDAEHAWHMAIMALLLKEYANEEIDVLKTMTMLLVHDIVEIDAGDTFAYDEEGKKTQRARELAAADRIFSILPEEQGSYLRELWDEFEEYESPEACFAHALDNFQPTMLNMESGGKSWAEHNTCISSILGRNKKTSKGSEVLWDYMWQNFLKPNVDNGKIRNE